MGRFKNKVSAATKQRSSTIKVNPYELPEKALAIIANICTKQNQDDANILFDKLRPVLMPKHSDNNFFDFIDQNRSELNEIDFIQILNDKLKHIATELSAHENTKDTQIVVAGGFSAGKSSFLNTITESGHLLPTGIEPVSMISTYLYFSDKVKDIVVKGINLKDALVLLDKDVLQCIQHASSSKVYLASVLNKLFVEIPSKHLKGLVFIDTPGYNNSDKKNETNGQTDETTATDSFKDGNVLFWIIDIENGTIPTNDKKMINLFLENHDNDGKVVIIFNKADKKSESDIKLIVDNAAKEYHLGSDKRFIDILAYTCTENKIVYSKKGYSMPKLLKEVKDSGNGLSSIDKYIAEIEKLFDEEIDFANFYIEDLTEKKKEQVDAKDAYYKLYMQDKDACKTYVDTLNTLMVDSYNEVKQAADNLTESSLFALNKFEKFYDGVMDFERNDHWGSSNVLDRALKRGSSDYSKCCDKHNAAIKYTYYEEEHRKKWVEYISQELDKLNKTYKEMYEKYDNLEKELAQQIKETEVRIHGFRAYKSAIVDTFKKAIREFQYGAHKPQDARLTNSTTRDIFAAIASGNYSNFMDCFTNGVSLSTYSAQGFSPLTFAAKEGAIDMVRFFVAHNADITALDQNGYNAFHVASIYGYKNICELLIDTEPSIATSLSKEGKNAVQLAEEYPFINWLKTQL